MSLKIEMQLHVEKFALVHRPRSDSKGLRNQGRRQQKQLQTIFKSMVQIAGFKLLPPDHWTSCVAVLHRWKSSQSWPVQWHLSCRWEPVMRYLAVGRLVNSSQYRTDRQHLPNKICGEKKQSSLNSKAVPLVKAGAAGSRTQQNQQSLRMKCRL